MKIKIDSDGAKMMLYLINVVNVVNMPQPSVRIGGGLHALIHIYFLHGGSKSPKPHWDLKYEKIQNLTKPQKLTGSDPGS